jgi:signal transduction histidine kinase
MAFVVRFENDERSAIVFVGASNVDVVSPGTRWELEEGMAATKVFRTGLSARSHVAELKPGGSAAETVARFGLGILSTVASPITVEGRLWGAVVVSSTEEFPLDTEDRVKKFTELVATAISNAESREARAVLAEEQAALRRVATLVASGITPEEVFQAVAAEVGVLFGSDTGAIVRFEDDRTVTVLGAVTGPHETGKRVTLDPGSAVDVVRETGRSARFDTDDPWAPDMPSLVQALGIRSAVASPIVVQGELWGALTTASLDGPLPLGAERRLTEFTELVATAVANAESSAELAASRRRIVAASDDARCRIERDLHDGVQQELVSLTLELDMMQANPPAGETLKEQLASVSDNVGAVLDSLVEIARGIHPAILSQGGLETALISLGRRSPVPVEVDARIDRSLPDAVEVAAYYVVSEALTNVAKHARASVVNIDATTDDGTLTLVVRDDGVGGAALGEGSGLVGLQDRVEALGGTIMIDSAPGSGTCVVVTLPIAAGPDQEIEKLLGPPQEIGSPTSPT